MDIYYEQLKVIKFDHEHKEWNAESLEQDDSLYGGAHSGNRYLKVQNMQRSTVVRVSTEIFLLVFDDFGDPQSVKLTIILTTHTHLTSWKALGWNNGNQQPGN